MIKKVETSERDYPFWDHYNDDYMNENPSIDSEVIYIAFSEDVCFEIKSSINGVRLNKEEIKFLDMICEKLKESKS